MYTTVRRTIEKLTSRLKENLDRDSGLYWGLSRQDTRVQDQSHWRGVRRWENNRWIEYGKFHFDLLAGYLRTIGEQEYLETLHTKTALEWGCGGGANVRVLCRHFSRVYGTDVSEATLDECDRQMKSFGFRNFEKILFSSEHPEAVLNHTGGKSIDIVISVAVFQHFPSREYSRRVLSVMEGMMKEGGYGLIQVRFFDGSEKLRQKHHDYAKNVIYMTSFRHEEFAEQLHEAGFTLLHSEREVDDPRDCHEYYFFRK